VLEVRDLAAGYGEFHVLAGVTLTIPPAEMVALLGPNGAGKTTLLRCITGLLRPRAGSIRWDGADLRAVLPHTIVERGIAMVPEGRRLFTRMTVEDNLTLGAFAPRTRPGATAAQERVYAMFPVLAQRRADLVGTLSGGQQQMVAIGRALMSQPRLLILDEPSLGLAPRVVESIFAALEEIARTGVSIFLAEQNVRAALTLARRACILEGGRVTREAASQALLDDPDVRRAYLGPMA
jgi:branched-chain amino acid transport system ATP-binding protein